MFFMPRLFLLSALLIALIAAFASQPTLQPARATSTEAQAQPDQLFGLPFNTDPGPATWLMGQVYGNSTGAFARRREWYQAGQGIHFGIDFSAKCGTPVVSIGDGVVMKVDAREHGSAPHNLLIDHRNGYTSLYGHLLRRPNLSVGQQVKKGEVVGVTGDPDLTCTSRPHLHLEIRDRTLRKAYNAHLLIDADWDVLALSGSFGRGFQRDLDNPRKWQSLFDQPDINFGGPLINEFERTWPRDWR
jgi:murein DD-endopeptidase MepM/ murein hydrolase activator NlpD